MFLECYKYCNNCTNAAMVATTGIYFCLYKISERKIRSQFIDSLRLLAKGGGGGMGYPKFGGIGGDGGDVFVIGKEGQTLRKIAKKHPGKRVTAGNGENSHKKKILGEKGSNAIIEAPIGLTLYAENGKKLGEINAEGEQVLIAKGGIGGRPETGHGGLRGESHIVTLDLKLIADVGLIGFPNAGKSTLLSALSKAKPKIASYPFTTIKPNVGIISYPDLRSLSMADLPGLIEGAHLNVGMGHNFLKHVERTKILIFVVDVGGFRLGHKFRSRSCLETIVLLNKELELYREDLIDRPSILIVNKMDKKGSKEILEEIHDAVKNFNEVFDSVPEAYRPTKAIEFSRVLGMSAKSRIPMEIEEVKKQIRDVLDNTYAVEIDEFKASETFKAMNTVRGPIGI